MNTRRAKEFLSDAAKALMEGILRVGAVTPPEDDPRFDEPTAYRFRFRRQRVLVVVTGEKHVTINLEVHPVTSLGGTVFDRIHEACASRSAQQAAEERGTMTRRREGKRVLRRLTRDFDQRILTNRRLVAGLGHQGNRIACGRNRRPVPRYR